MDFSLIFKLLTTLSVTGTVFGCSCVRSHPQQKFCDSVYVIRGQVLGSNTVTVPSVSSQQLGSVFYKVKVLDVFKDDGNSIKVGDTITIETAASSGVCGVTLDNDEYLLGGPTHSAIQLCGIVTKWKQVKECQKTMLSNRFNYDCRCQIEVCERDKVCQSSMKACKMAFNEEVEQGAVCKRVGRWCKWRSCPSEQNIFMRYLFRLF